MVDGSVTSIGLVPGGDEHRTLSAADSARIGALGLTRQAQNVGLPGLGDYRIIARPGRDGDVLVTGLSEHGVDDTIGRLALIEAAVFALVLLAVGVLGALSVRLSLRPLTRVADNARQIAGMPLATGEVALPRQTASAGPGTEVGQVTDSFNQMIEHVEAALRQRQASEERLRQFVADASHELRTPLAVVRSHADYARRVDAPIADEVATALRRIASESARMGSLVDDLLLLARLDAGRPLAREPVDLTRIVMEAVDDARIAGDQQYWQLELPDEPVMIVGDAGRLHQAIANLLANARIHTSPGTTVVTRVSSAGEPGAVEVVVRDDGPGIAASVLPRIFERFMRADEARSHEAGSTGLGLAITDAILRAHGGSVQVSSSPGRTEFTLRLPAAHGAGLLDRAGGGRQY